MPNPSDTFQIGKKVFTHSTARTVFIPDEGPAEGQPFGITAKSMAIDLGGSAIVLEGNSVQPIATAFGKASPTFSFGLDTMQIHMGLMEHVGDGYAVIGYTIQVTWQRAGLAPITFRCLGCTVEKGFGFKSDSGGAPNDEISGKFQDLEVIYKGTTYRPFKLPGTIDLS